MSFYRHALAIVFLFFCAIGSAWAGGGLFSWGKDAEFLDAVDIVKLEDVRRQGDSFEAAENIADNYYIYRLNAAGVP